MHPLRLAGILLAASAAAPADEGMWLFNKPPVRRIKEAHGFEITPAWLDHLQKASVRFNNGGSGSFVSAAGLILTNHHVGAGVIQKLRVQERDLMKDGFLAKTRDEELKCPDLELNILIDIEDVTARVTDAVKEGMSAEQAAAARRAAIAEIERSSFSETGLRSDVVTLYRGALFHLHRYKRYTDVRLVFSPEKQAGFFGGDPDNFEYPRHTLDFCFFRAYEDGKPAAIGHFLTWNPKGAAEGELVFVSGHPGRTNRSLTHAQLVSLRDVSLPFSYERAARTEAMLGSWASRNRDNRRLAELSIFSFQNARKVMQANLGALLDPAFMERKARNEDRLRKAFESGHPEAAAAYDRIAAAEEESNAHRLRTEMLEEGRAFATALFPIARTLVRAADEEEKADGERLREYQAAGRVSLELQLFSDKPIFKHQEIVTLTDSLAFLCAKLGADDPLVRRIMDGKPPEKRATELVARTNLDDPEYRRELYLGGKDAVSASSDPMIVLARLVDEEARALRARQETCDEIRNQAHQAIAAARFALEGDDSYPDATFTLRLSYGLVKGYLNHGEKLPAHTTLGGLYERSEAQEATPPFDLPERWIRGRDAIDTDTPLNFVCTADITGGNSGSPVVNRAGELVGVIFDSNLDGIVHSFGYFEGNGRALAVHTAGMLEALKIVYDAGEIVEELTFSSNPE